MASPRGTILPVSSLTFHSLMCLHLEAVLLLGESGAASREQRAETFSSASAASNSAAPPSSGSRCVVWTALYEQPSSDSAVHVRQHSRECPGYLWRCHTGYTDYAAQHRSEYGPGGEDQCYWGLCV